MCDFCLQTADSNRKGEPEDLLICRDCGNRGIVYFYLILCALCVYVSSSIVTVVFLT